MEGQQMRLADLQQPLVLVVQWIDVAEKKKILPDVGLILSIIRFIIVNVINHLSFPFEK